MEKKHSDKKIEEYLEEIASHRQILKTIKQKIGERVTSDINKYDLQSEHGRRKVDKMPFRDLFKAKRIYEAELKILVGRLMWQLKRKKEFLEYEITRNENSEELKKELSETIENLNYYKPRISKPRQILVRC